MPPTLAPDSTLSSSIEAGGIAVHTENLPWLKSIAVGFFVPFGSVNETPQQNGAAHFIEHLVFKGTKRRNARQLALAIERYGGNVNAATEKELTSYFCRIDASHLDIALDVLADICFNAEFRPNLVQRERTVVIEEIEGNLDDPGYFLFDNFLRKVWGNTALGRPITGDATSVGMLKRDVLYHLWKTHYRPERMILSVVGGVDHARVVTAWNRVAAQIGLKGSKRGDHLVPKLNPVMRSGTHVWNRPGEQASVILGFRGIPMGDQHRHALACLDGVLAAGMGSRLFQSLRERQGLVYDVSSMHLPYRGAGLYLLEAGCNPSRLQRVTKSLVKECTRLCETPVPLAELRRVQDFLAGSYSLSLESPSNRMFRLALSHIYLGRFETPEEVLSRIRAVTPAELQAFARELFDMKHVAIGAVVPEGVDSVKMKAHLEALPQAL